MTTEELRVLIAQGEGETLEFNLFRIGFGRKGIGEAAWSWP